MREVNILVLGFGNVGREFVKLVEDKRIRLGYNYGLKPVWLAVFRRKTRWDIPQEKEILPLLKDLINIYRNI